MITRKLNPRVYDSLLVLLDAVRLYRVYGRLDNLPLSIYIINSCYYTFVLNFGTDIYIAYCCTHHFMLADLSLAARTIDNIHSSYNLNVSTCNCSKNICYLVQPWDPVCQF